MAKYLRFDKSQQGVSGLIPLKRGDDWRLLGQVVNRVFKSADPVDLTGAAATAFFPADASDDVDGVIDVPVTITSDVAGRVEIDVPASASTGVALAEEGTSMYLTVDHPTEGLLTIETEMPVLEIKDRGFDS